MDEASRFTAMMQRSAELKRRIAVELAGSVIAVVDACETSLRGGGKLMFCGNGGSAADSQHLATEMLIRLRGSVERAVVAGAGADARPGGADRRRQRLRLRACVRAPVAGAGAERRRAVRHHHLRPLGQRGAGAAGGARNGHRHRGPARRGGEPALGLCDHALLVPDNETARIQECHIALGHAVLELLEDRLVARPL